MSLLKKRGLGVGFVGLSCLGVIAVGGCRGRGEQQSAPESAAERPAVRPAVAPVPSSADPAASARSAAAKVLNPSDRRPYAGPVATLKGRVRIDGPTPPDSGLKISPGCAAAVATYGKLFRVGSGGELADAMVAVTGYDAFVPAKDTAVRVSIRQCAFERRTVVATFGQTIDVVNLDATLSYVPYLDGGRFRVLNVAVPGGDAVHLHPQEPGRYMLRDQLPKEFMVADVFVLAYPTATVTGLDGLYEVQGIPTGQVRVNAYLPVLGQTVERKVELHEGDNELDLTLHYEPSAPAAPAGSSAPN